MKTALKRTLAVILTAIMVFSVIPLTASAKENEPAVVNNTTAQIKQTNSLSKLLAESTDMEQVSMDSPYYISEITFDGQTANVRYYNEADCTLVVAVYDESTEQMLASEITSVYAESITADVEFESSLPQHFIAKAFLLDENNAPLCKNLTCRNYTTEYEKMAALTVDDFDSSKVVNLDDKKDNNFVVLSDDVVTIKGTGSKNVLYSSDVETNTYVIKNIDSTVKNLKAGDSFYLDNGDVDNFLAIKIKSISISGTTATIIADDSEEEDLFECIKIDSLASAGQADYSSEAADEAVEYEGEVNYETEEAEFHTDSVDVDFVDFSLSHKFKIKEKEYKNKSGKVEGKFSGAVTFSAKIGFSATFSGDYKEVAFTIDPSIKVEVKATGSIKLLEIPLGKLSVRPVAAVEIGLEPEFVVKVSGELSTKCELKFTLGVGYNSKDGFINKCKKPSLEAEVKAEVTLFIGFDLQPNVALLSKHVAKVTLSGEIGVEAKAALSKSSGTSTHFCSACIDGDLTGKLEISVKLTFGEDTKLEKEYKATLIELSWKLGNFYYSISHNEFGFGSCPYNLKKFTVKVTDSKGNPIKDAIVSTNSAGDSGTNTDAKGEASITGSCGKIILTIEAYGYRTVTRNIDVSEDTVKFYITLKQIGIDDIFTGNESVGDIIEFGSYPQSKVTDSATISALDAKDKYWCSYGYYSGTGDITDGNMKPSDYMKYCDISYNGNKYRAVTFSSYRPCYTGYKEITSTSTSVSHTYQDDNGYYTGNVYYFKYEPLKWRVLDPSEGFVMCNTAIDAQAYNNYILYYDNGNNTSDDDYYGNSAKTYYASDWANSSIRVWLNNDFYNTAFTSSEKSQIGTTYNENKSTYSSQYDSANTNDKIFLLSKDEVLNSKYGFSSSYSTYDTARQLKSTDYAKCQGCYQNTGSTMSYLGNSLWRLRSPYSSGSAAFVSNGGHAYSSDSAGRTSYGIVPAFKFNPKSTIKKSPAQSLKLAAAPKSAEKADGINITYSACKAGCEYILLNVLDYSEEFILTNDKLLYIDQLTADENGRVSTAMFPKKNDENSTTLLIGDFGSGTEARVITSSQVQPELTLEKTEVTVNVGETVSIKATGRNISGISAKGKAESTDKSIATGKFTAGKIEITGIKPGTTTVIVQMVNGDTNEILDTKNITVTVVTKPEITLSQTNVNMNVGDEAKITRTVTVPEGTKVKHTYKNNNKDIVSYNYKDSVITLTALKAGTAQIELFMYNADTDELLDTKTITVTVSEIKLAVKMNLSSSIQYDRHGAHPIKPTVTIADGIDYTIKYSSSDTSVAIVSTDGLVMTKHKGDTTITCTVTDEYGNVAKDTCNVNVYFSFGQWLIWILLLGFLWY